MESHVSSIGELLAAEREHKGKSIQDVERALKIRAKYIEALEANDFDAIPGDAYVTGFMKVYCEFLGIDPAPLIDGYRDGHEQPRLTMPQPVMSARKEHPRIPRALWIVMLALAGVAFTGWLGMSLVSAFKPSTPAPEQTTTVVAEPTKTAPPPKAVVPPPKKRPRAFTMKVAASEEHWLSVTVDGRKAYDDNLSAGQAMTWRVRKSIVLRTDAPELFRLWRNGKYAGPLGTGFTLQTRRFKALVK